MIFGVLILVVIGVGVGIAFMMKSKGGSSDDGMMSVPPRPVEVEPPAQTLSERLEQHTNVTSVPRSPVEDYEREEEVPEAPAEPRELTPFEAAPDLSVRSDEPIEEASAAAGADPADHVSAPVAEVSAPVVDDAPEPMVRARVQPAAAPATAAVSRDDDRDRTGDRTGDGTGDDDEDDDETVVSRLRVPGQRPVKAVEPTTVEAPAPAARVDADVAAGSDAVAPPAAEPEPEPEPEAEPTLLPSFLEQPAVAVTESPVESAAEPESEPASEPAQTTLDEPEASSPDLAVEPEPAEPAVADAEPAVAALVADAPSTDAAHADDADAGTQDADGPIAVFEVSADADAAAPAEKPDIFAALHDAQVSGDLSRIDERDPEPLPVDASAASTEPEEIEPELASGTTPPPVQFVLEPEPEADPVDHILKALVNRAKARQVGIAEVAAELVEQANLEDRDIDEVLADLVERVDEDDEQVNPAARLEELTFFNESVPRRPGQITDYDRLDKAAKKKVIIRVLCLLVAMQEDNRLKPSDPRSEAETRHWPLARAVWPVPVANAAEADAAADEADDTADGDKKLPGRRLLRTKR